jgi:hypothetical protein
MDGRGDPRSVDTPLAPSATDLVGVLTRWEDFGGTWRVTARIGPEVTVALCRCDGIEEQRLRSSDVALIAWLGDRVSSAP